MDHGGNPMVFRYGEGWGSDYGYVAPSDTSQHWVVFAGRLLVGGVA